MRRIFLLVFISSSLLAQQSVPAALSGALEQWKSAVAAGDASTIDGLYSKNPPAYVMSTDGKQRLPVSEETNFWQGTRSAVMQDFRMAVRKTEEKQGVELVNLLLSFRTRTPHGIRTRYVIEQQAWMPQQSSWRLVASTHTDVLKIRPPEKLDPHLYEKEADARVDIAQAVKKAAVEHKRVILVFGGNWCYDCHVLETALHEPDVAPAARQFEFVHVDIGDDGKKNGDLVKKYRIPIEKGVPALAVLSDTGALLYSDQHGEFEKARSMDPDDVVAFLNKWKAGASR